MGIRTEPWWICRICNGKIKKVKSKSKRGTLRALWLLHRKDCVDSVLYKKQVKQ